MTQNPQLGLLIPGVICYKLLVISVLNLLLSKRNGFTRWVVIPWRVRVWRKRVYSNDGRADARWYSTRPPAWNKPSAMAKRSQMAGIIDSTESKL